MYAYASRKCRLYHFHQNVLRSTWLKAVRNHCWFIIAIDFLFASQWSQHGLSGLSINLCKYTLQVKLNSCRKASLVWVYLMQDKLYGVGVGSASSKMVKYTLKLKGFWIQPRPLLHAAKHSGASVVQVVGGLLKMTLRHFSFMQYIHIRSRKKQIGQTCLFLITGWVMLGETTARLTSSRVFLVPSLCECIQRCTSVSHGDVVIVLSLKSLQHHSSHQNNVLF